jgi:NAD(P)H-dependent flavin oxidoreductase YrpB (nitropropane dioxygenase family)
MSLHTPLCDLLNIQVPIIQAGMGWDKEGMTTPPELVAAVSKAGSDSRTDSLGTTLD